MRSKNAHLRQTEPDLIYNSRQVQKLINRCMHDGKKSVAQKQVYNALDIIKEKTKANPIELFDAAINNVTPKMEVRSRRVGGAAYQVPMPVRMNRAYALATRWLIMEARKRPSRDFHTFAEKLAAELMDAAQNQGGAVQKKLTAHKMAEANKAFAHFRW
jgi:small subunit ribosomal protein S7